MISTHVSRFRSVVHRAFSGPGVNERVPERLASGDAILSRRGVAEPRQDRRDYDLADGIIPDYTLLSGEKAILVLDAKRPSEDILSTANVQQA